jgi:hypothetical protein
MPNSLSNPVSREFWGYWVWGATSLVVLIPELAAVFTNWVLWPTISGTVGHLEYRWTWVALLVLAVIVFCAYHAVVDVAIGLPATPVALGADDAIAGGVAPLRVPGRRQSTRIGGLPAPAEDVVGPDTRSAVLAFAVVSVLVVVAATLFTRSHHPGNKFVVAYVLYGLIALLGVGVPTSLAYWGGKTVPFPPVFETVSDLEKRWHIAGVLILAALAILAFHLALYPWPGLERDLQDLHHTQPSITSP